MLPPMTLVSGVTRRFSDQSVQLRAVSGNRARVPSTMAMEKLAPPQGFAVLPVGGAGGGMMMVVMPVMMAVVMVDVMRVMRMAMVMAMIVKRITAADGGGFFDPKRLLNFDHDRHADPVYEGTGQRVIDGIGNILSTAARQVVGHCVCFEKLLTNHHNAGKCL